MIRKLLERIRHATTATPAPPKPRREPVLDWYVPPPPAPPEPEEETLRRRLTVAEIEADNPGFAGHARWEEIKATMQPGDELWSFHSPSWTWQALCGRAGIALVRDGAIVAELITMMN